jgi:hypothetical protein
VADVIQKLFHLFGSGTPEILVGAVVFVLSFGVRKAFRKP